MIIEHSRVDVFYFFPGVFRLPILVVSNNVWSFSRILVVIVHCLGWQRDDPCFTMTLWFDRISYEANQDGTFTPTYWGIGRELLGEPRSCVGVIFSANPFINLIGSHLELLLQVPIWIYFGFLGLIAALSPKVFLGPYTRLFPTQIFPNLECRKISFYNGDM